MIQHKVKRTTGYELHHVIPLSWADSPEQYKLFDKWQNMVYIDALSHAIITQNRNRNVVMSIKDDGFVLSDYNQNSVYLENKKSILYDTTKQENMFNYNKQLLTTI